MLTTALSEDGWKVTASPDGETAIDLLGRERFDLILTDVCLPSAGGMEVLEAARRHCPSAPVVMMTAFGSIELAVSAMKAGARDFITKPFQIDTLLSVLEACLPGRPSEMVGNSPAFMAAVERAMKAASSGLTVLILGESGTGKELLARAVHEASDRRDGPFIPVNCAAIPSELMESELFGAEKGAYTGADCRRSGRFELAAGGTVFLDEVGDLAPNLQGKLLRVLQEKEFTRVGGSEILRADVRVLAASNRDLEGESSAGRFRQDLYYRLCEFPVRLPALRERVGDVRRLAVHFLDEAGLPGGALDERAMVALEAYSWPGNIRELRNIVLRAAALNPGGVMGPGDLEIPSREGRAGSGMLGAAEEAAAETRRRMIVEALESSGGNRARAAALLGISYRTLRTRMKELGL
jgi:DNA-binding NtrC family response regulator